MSSGLSASQPAGHPAELKFHGDFISTEPPAFTFLKAKVQNSMEAGPRDVSEMVCLFWTYRICHVKQRCDVAFDNISRPSTYLPSQLTEPYAILNPRYSTAVGLVNGKSV
jgi:hypothetical protein